MSSKKSIYIIAEAGVNHNGSINHALDLVDNASYVGANAIKFQLFNPKKLVTKSLKQAKYQKANFSKKYSNQLEMLSDLQIEKNFYIS